MLEVSKVNYFHQFLHVCKNYERIFAHSAVEYQLKLIELQSLGGLKSPHRENKLLLFYEKLHFLKNEFNQILNLSKNDYASGEVHTIVSSFFK